MTDNESDEGPKEGHIPVVAAIPRAVVQGIISKGLWVSATGRRGELPAAGVAVVKIGGATAMGSVGAGGSGDECQDDGGREDIKNGVHGGFCAGGRGGQVVVGCGRSQPAGQARRESRGQ